jgi:Uncharacterized conserved protein (DUF2203)
VAAPDDWSVEEADAALPRITAVVERVRSAAGGARDHVRATAAAGPGNGHSPARAQALAFAAAVDELAAEGIVLRDADRGLVDFPAVALDGRRYWLCWVVGEASVAWWHWPDDGFAGRKSLSERPG